MPTDTAFHIDTHAYTDHRPVQSPHGGQGMGYKLLPCFACAGDTVELLVPTLGGADARPPIVEVSVHATLNANTCVPAPSSR